jgi:Rrf2 family protein
VSDVRNALPGVIVPARLDYAVRAMVSLALASTERTKVDVIATDHDLSRKFLAHTLTRLRDAGMVATRRGASGGYQLARPAAEISVADVFDAVSPRDVREARTFRNGSQAAALSAAAWNRIEAALRAGLGTLTVAELAGTGSTATKASGTTRGRALRSSPRS